MTRRKTDLSRVTKKARSTRKCRSKILAQRAFRHDSPAAPVEKIKPVWTDLQTDALVQGVFEAINNKPECFEQPKPKEFYEQIKSKSLILKPIFWTFMKSRMFHVKSQYLIYAALKEENCDTDMTMEYIHQQCPNFDKLAVIFKNCISNQNTPNIPYEKSITVDGDNNKNETANQDASLPDVENVCIRNGSDEIVLKIEVASRNSTPEPSSSQSCIDIMETENNRSAKKRSTRQCTQVTCELPLPPIYKKSKKQKPKKYTAISNQVKLQQLAYDRQKLELTKEKQRQDFQIKIAKMKNNLELRKYEIEKKLESEERLKKYEMELKSKNSSI